MPDYNSNEIVDILLMLGECKGNYRRAAALYHQKFPRRKHHPNDSMIRIIERRGLTLIKHLDVRCKGLMLINLGFRC